MEVIIYQIAKSTCLSILTKPLLLLTGEHIPEVLQKTEVELPRTEVDGLKTDVVGLRTDFAGAVDKILIQRCRDCW